MSESELISALIAAEYGYRAAERGHNIEAMRAGLRAFYANQDVLDKAIKIDQRWLAAFEANEQ